ncbi:conserved protein of unknown function [Pseudomonas marincola]|uniref:Uncharacterized protein n=1 Tax=Pseudomonas marincola TaxID=437900 RepID=A0A653E878_9PSED|nr:conserved protein of unknown function [Pseudomonas marincola]
MKKPGLDARLFHVSDNQLMVRFLTLYSSSNPTKSTAPYVTIGERSAVIPTPLRCA